MANLQQKHEISKNYFDLGVDLVSVFQLKGVRLEVLSKDYDLSLGLAICRFSYEYEDKGYYNIESDRDKIKLFTELGTAKYQKFVDTGVLEKVEATGKHYLFFGNGAIFDLVDSTDFLEYTGNESQNGERAYRSMIISLTPKIK